MRSRLGDDRDDGGRSEEQARLEAERLRTVIGMKFLPAHLDDIAEFLPRCPFEEDEAPRRELAVVGHSDGDFEDGLGLFGRWPGLPHRFDGG